jgi:hypothetical protein
LSVFHGLSPIVNRDAAGFLNDKAPRIDPVLGAAIFLRNLETVEEGIDLFAPDGSVEKVKEKERKSKLKKTGARNVPVFRRPRGSKPKQEPSSRQGVDGLPLGCEIP